MEIIKKRNFDNDLEIKPVGRIDINTAVEFGQEINDEIEDFDVKNLIINFEEIEYVSSMGLRILLELQRKMDNLGSLKLINVKPEIMNIFLMTGFDKVLHIV